MSKRGWYIVIALAFLTACIPPIPETDPQLLQRVVRSTVQVLTENGMGSGTVVWVGHRSVLVLTCAHVVKDAKVLRVVSPMIEEANATVEKYDESIDLALLMATVDNDLPAIRPAHSEPELYSRLFLMGAPVREYGTVSEGFLSEKGDGHYWRVTGGLVLFGISGGTAVNKWGELVCVPAAVRMLNPMVPVPQMGFCIPLPTIKRFLRGYPT